jgi:hypothetical protein
VVGHPGHEADHSPHSDVEIMSAAVKAVPLFHAQVELQLYTFIKNH